MAANNVRAYAQYHGEPVAVLVAKDGRVDRLYRDISRFPRIALRRAMPIPKSSLLFCATQQLTHPSIMDDARAEAWLESYWGKPLPLYGQMFFQRGGFALIVFWAEMPDEDEADEWEETTSKQRLQERQARWVAKFRSQKPQLLGRIGRPRLAGGSWNTVR